MPFILEMELKASRLRGHDHFWDVIRAHGVGGEFTVVDVVGQTNAHQASVDDFVRRLLRAGYLALAGYRQVANPHWTVNKAVKARLYRVLKVPSDTPSLRRDGSAGSYGTGRQNMWNILRGPQAREGIDARDLVLLAETDDVPVSLASAKEYLGRLEVAGYLKVAQKAASGRLTRYRLAPGMNTGPKAPKLLKTRVVYDPNRREVVGDTVAEEVSP